MLAVNTIAVTAPPSWQGRSRHITDLLEQPLLRRPIRNKLAIFYLVGDVGRSGVAVGLELDAFGHAVEIHLHDLGLDLLAGLEQQLGILDALFASWRKRATTSGRRDRSSRKTLIATCLSMSRWSPS